MLDKFDHLLACLGEECGEVQQCVGKALRFGILDSSPEARKTNWVDLVHEVQDIVAIYEMLCDDGGMTIELDRHAIEEKKKRVLKYMDYARERGRLSDN